MPLAELENQLLALPESDRIHLLELLWESLAPDDIRWRADKWTDEAERRLDAVNAGELPLLDAQKAFRELRGQSRP